MVKDKVVFPEYDHMVIIVHLEHDYLVDVGNGQSFREPLRIDGANSALSEGYSYRIGIHGQDDAMYFRHQEAAWAPRYLFTTTPREQMEFSDMCHYHQTSPDSIFTRQRLVTMATHEGRISLIDMQLIITKGAEKCESVVYSRDEYDEILKQQFGIELNSAHETAGENGAGN